MWYIFEVFLITHILHRILLCGQTAFRRRIIILLHVVCCWYYRMCMQKEEEEEMALAPRFACRSKKTVRDLISYDPPNHIPWNIIWWGVLSHLHRTIFPHNPPPPPPPPLSFSLFLVEGDRHTSPSLLSSPEAFSLKTTRTQ